MKKKLLAFIVFASISFQMDAGNLTNTSDLPNTCPPAENIQKKSILQPFIGVGAAVLGLFYGVLPHLTNVEPAIPTAYALRQALNVVMLQTAFCAYSLVAEDYISMTLNGTSALVSFVAIIVMRNRPIPVIGLTGNSLI